jgi:hypothetical protein
MSCASRAQATARGFACLEVPITGAPGGHASNRLTLGFHVGADARAAFTRPENEVLRCLLLLGVGIATRRNLASGLERNCGDRQRPIAWLSGWRQWRVSPLAKPRSISRLLDQSSFILQLPASRQASLPPHQQLSTVRGALQSEGFFAHKLPVRSDGSSLCKNPSIMRACPAILKTRASPRASSRARSFEIQPGAMQRPLLSQETAAW